MNFTYHYFSWGGGDYIDNGLFGPSASYWMIPGTWREEWF